MAEIITTTAAAEEVRAPTLPVGARCERSNASVACPSPGGGGEARE